MENNGNPMMAFLRAAFFALACLSSFAATTAPASAAGYPDRPVRWLIGFAPGGPVDIVARIMSQWLADHFGQQFVVENRAGSRGHPSAAPAVNSPAARYHPLCASPH